MAVKFNNSRIRLWKGDTGDSTNIGIRFNKDCKKEEIDQVYDNVESFLTSKYGDGVEGVDNK